MKPKIVMHTQLSLDGRIRGFDRPDLYYIAAGRYSPDAVLFGSNTVNAALLYQHRGHTLQARHLSPPPFRPSILPETRWRGILGNSSRMKRECFTFSP